MHLTAKKFNSESESDKCLNDTVVNRTSQFIDGGSLEISLIVPLSVMIVK